MSVCLSVCPRVECERLRGPFLTRDSSKWSYVTRGGYSGARFSIHIDGLCIVRKVRFSELTHFTKKMQSPKIWLNKKKKLCYTELRLLAHFSTPLLAPTHWWMLRKVSENISLVMFVCCLFVSLKNHWRDWPEFFCGWPWGHWAEYRLYRLSILSIFFFFFLDFFFGRRVRETGSGDGRSRTTGC